jgi:hypothetical protein
MGLQHGQDFADARHRHDAGEPRDQLGQFVGMNGWDHRYFLLICTYKLFLTKCVLIVKNASFE